MVEAIDMASIDTNSQNNYKLIECIGIEVFPFLCLPIELRILTYRYLVPNIDISSHPMPSRFPNPESPTEIREDKQICTPGILRVSKQIYQEAITEFYGCGRFQLTVVRRGEMTFDFLGYGYLFDDVLPPVLNLVRNLKLTIKVNRSPTPERAEQIAHLFRRCFLHPERSALETMHIEFGSFGYGVFWSEHLQNANLLSDTLDRYLGPLKEVRELKAVTAVQHLDMPNDHDRGGLGNEFEARRDAILVEIKTTLEELVKLMVLPLQATSTDRTTSKT